MLILSLQYIPKAKDATHQSPGSLKLNIKVRGRDQKLEAEAKGSQGQGQRLRGRGRGQNFGLEALTSLIVSVSFGKN